ncbi:hypothetical protein DID74_01040 [Candidatus Marinamargulisbacteria bacterium SCGC AG-333-B06]|nr:hypothetical protein DID74_01040 [Candidatus Marinamargulisbacteria bacterium SCGC AG-333-B06]
MTLYKIGDICDLLSITPRTIRYYDQLGLLPNTKRSDGYTRLFDQHDIDTIKSIRLLQKKQGLPLNSIKETLFPNNLSDKKIFLITDSFSQQKLPLSSDLTVIPINEADSADKQSKQLYDYIDNNIPSSSIYICFFHTLLAPAYTALTKQFPKNTYFLYPLHHFGMTNYMITDYIYSNLDSYSNLNELHLVINRMITLGFSLCLLDSLATYVSAHHDYMHPHHFLSPVTAYHPILLSNHSQQSAVSFQADFLTNTDYIASIFDDFLMKQKRYVQKACIYYSHTNSLAKRLKTSLESQCPNLSITTVQIKDWSSPKNKVNFVSII